MAFIPVLKWEKKELSPLWKEQLSGRVETHRSQFCGSVARATSPAVSPGTSAPCLLCALLQLHCPGSIEEILSPSSDGKGNSTPRHKLLTKNPSPKILNLHSNCNSRPFSRCLHQVLKPHEPTLLPTDHQGFPGAISL